MSTRVYAALTALLFATGGCKLTAKGEAKVETEEDTEVITVDVETEPKAHVFLLEGGEPVKSTAVKYAGEDPTHYVVADDDGKARLRLPIWADDAAKRELSITVEHVEKRFGRYPRFDLKVTAKRGPSIHVKDGTVTCVQKKCTGLLRADLALEMSAIEDGAKVTIAGGPVAVATGGTTVAVPDYAKLFASESLDAVFGEIKDEQVSLPISFDLPDGTSLKRAVAVSKVNLRDALVGLMKDADRKAVLLPGETKESKGTGALLNVDPPQLFGKATKPGDVDFVAIRSDAPKREKACGAYSSHEGGIANLRIDLIDASISIYERRTGKRRLQRTIDANPACPTTWAQGNSVTYRPGQTQIDDFLAAFVKSPNTTRGGGAAGPGGGSPSPSPVSDAELF